VLRHPSFLLKIKITILDIFYISLSLSLIDEEGVHTLASIKHTFTLRVPHSVSHPTCVIIILIIVNAILVLGLKICSSIFLLIKTSASFI
jgi:hypothetical protein